MRSVVTAQFRKMLESLPQQVQEEARAGFEKWKQDPASVGWKRLAGMVAEVHSVEIGRRWRAIGVVSKEHQAVVWTFVGSHETYNRYIEIHRKMSQSAWMTPTLKDRLEGRRSEKTISGPRRPSPLISSP